VAEGRRRVEGAPEYWAAALEGLRASVEEVVTGAYRAWRRAVEGLRAGLDRVLAGGRDLSRLLLAGSLRGAYEAALRGAVGVDSSLTRPIRLGFRFVSLASAAAVELGPGVGGGGRGAYMRVRPVVLPDEAPPEHARLELTLEMFTLEAEALHAAASRAPPTLFLDGPIVDPPAALAGVRRAGLEGKYERYVERRVDAVSAALRAGSLVVGYVKRLRGRLFAEWASQQLGGPDWAAGVNDAFLGAALAEALRGPLTREACRGGGLVVATRPVEVDERRASDYSLYRQRGLRVYTSLVVPGFCSGNTRPARLEVPVPPGADPEGEVLRAAAAVEAWLVEGAWQPAPVLAAHRACTIRRRESLRLLREAASLYALEMAGLLGGGEAVQGMLGALD